MAHKIGRERNQRQDQEAKASKGNRDVGSEAWRNHDDFDDEWNWLQHLSVLGNRKPMSTKTVYRWYRFKRFKFFRNLLRGKG